MSACKVVTSGAGLALPISLCAAVQCSAKSGIRSTGELSEEQVWTCWSPVLLKYHHFTPLTLPRVSIPCFLSTHS